MASTQDPGAEPHPETGPGIVLVPVKSFDQAKSRLADGLTPDVRAELARVLATNTVLSQRGVEVAVVCDDDTVAEWAAGLGAQVLHCATPGLNAAVADGVQQLAEQGWRRVAIVHSDLPMARSLAPLLAGDGVTIVPDRHRTGTNVLVVPADVGFGFAYGPDSFAAHQRQAERLGLGVRVVADADLGWDIDEPDDLDAHPLPPAIDAVVGTGNARPPRTGPRTGAAMSAGTSDITADRPVPTRVLAISAHPDDSELQAGATLAKWAAAGAEVSIVVCTDGSKGTWNPAADLAELVATRQTEQRAAAAALGATGTVGFCGWVDGELEHSKANVEVLARWIRELQPEIVITHDPWKRYRLHPDHRAAGFLVTDAVVAARDPHFFADMGLAHHRPDELWFFEADEPNHVEHVDGWLETKISALEEHKSQLESTMGFLEGDQSGRQAFHDDITAAAAGFGRLLDSGPAEGFARLTEL